MILEKAAYVKSYGWRVHLSSKAENLKNIMQIYNTIQDPKNVSSNLVNIKLCSTYL